MNIIKRIPSDEELENAKFNRKIEIIQEVCHLVAVVLLFVGMTKIICGSCAIEGNDVLGGTMDCIGGIVSMAFCALFANM